MASLSTPVQAIFIAQSTLFKCKSNTVKAAGTNISGKGLSTGISCRPRVGLSRRSRSRVIRAENDDEKNGRVSTTEKEAKDGGNGQLKNNEEFRKFMADPTTEAALKLEKKKTELRLAELDKEDHPGFIRGLISKASRSAVQRERERLERAEGQFKALDIKKLKECFGYDTFFATDVRRFGDGGIFVGNLRKPIEQVKPVLEQKLKETAGRDVDVWFLEEDAADGKKQVCVVQPKTEIDMQIDKLNNVYGYLGATLLGVTTLGSVALMSGFFLTPDATFDDYISRVAPLFGGFLTIFAVSEVSTRWTATRYGVTLSPTFLIPSNWTGCLGAINNFESLLPSKRALFDIAAVRATSAFLTSLLLAGVAFYLDKDFAGGENALYIRPQFFISNPLLSFVQYVIGPYSDELGNVLPQAVPGLGVPLDPLAFAGLLGMVVTAINLLPAGRLEGGRLAQAMVGRRWASILSFGTTLTLGFLGLGGSVLCLTWAFVAAFFRRGEELPAQDEITKLGTPRLIWGAALAIFAFMTLFPNSAGTFPSVFYTPPFWRNDF